MNLTGYKMSIPVIVLLLQGIPEGIAITTLAFVISGIHLKLTQIVLIGTALAICAYLVRLFPIPFGIHTILVIFLLFTCLSMVNKGDIGLSFVSSVLSCLILVMFETACLPMFKPISSITPEFLSTYHLVRIVLGEFHVVLLFILAFVLHKFVSKRNIRTSNS